MYTITKTTIENLKIRSVNGAFADINIDQKGETGRVQISSDYGNWQCYWGACGMPFKKFLTTLEIDYVAHKFGEANWFDLDATIKDLRSHVKDYTDDKELRTKIHEELNDLEESSSEGEFVGKMWRCEHTMHMEDQCPHLSRSISPSFKNFWQKFWPTFIQLLKTEIEVEQTI